MPAGVRTKNDDSALRPQAANEGTETHLSRPCLSAGHIGSFQLLWLTFSRTVARIFSNSVNLQKVRKAEKTKQTLKEDIEWMKEQARS